MVNLNLNTKSVFIFFISLVASIFLLECFLRLSLPNSGKQPNSGIQIDNQQKKNELLKNTISLPELKKQSKDIVSLKKDTQKNECKTKYYAIFKEENTVKCAFSKLRTAIIGPPPKFFQKSVDIVILTEDKQDKCVCLQNQKSFDNSDLPIERLSSFTVNSETYKIIKWVCGDSCYAKNK